MTTTKPLVSEEDGLPVEDAMLSSRRRKPAWKPKLAWFARWLHTYLSMFSFLILFFFAATGFTLNHANWFDSQQKVVQRTGTLDAAWVKGAGNDVNRAAIVDFFQKTIRIRGSSSDFNLDDTQCQLSFRGPGYEADVIIDRATGGYQITETYAGLVGVLNDLHKGRDTGAKWSVLIDVTAIAMALVALTGIVLIFFLTKRRTFGLLAIMIGAAVCYFAYQFWVP